MVLYSLRKFIVKLLGGYMIDHYDQNVKLRLRSIMMREDQILERALSIKKTLELK